MQKMLQTGTAYTPSQIMSLRLKGAMYIRMSTELQVESPENQERSMMGHASKQMVYEVYGKYVEGLEKDRMAILRYFGRDFLKGKG